MKNKELGILLQGLETIGDLEGVNLAYGIDKNRKMMAREVESFQEAMKPSKEFQEYDKKRFDVCGNLGEKDKNGKAKMENNQFVFSEEGKKKFDKEIGKLNKINKKVIEKRENQFKEFNELMEKESSFKPFLVNFKEVPKDIKEKQYKAISFLIKK